MLGNLGGKETKLATADARRRAKTKEREVDQSHEYIEKAWAEDRATRGAT